MGLLSSFPSSFPDPEEEESSSSYIPFSSEAYQQYYDDLRRRTPKTRVHGMEQIMIGLEPQCRAVGLVLLSDEYKKRDMSYPVIMLDEKGITNLMMNLRRCLRDLHHLPMKETLYGCPGPNPEPDLPMMGEDEDW